MSDDIIANYHGGHSRSVEAREATKPRKNTDYLRILALLHQRPAGLTCDEAEILLGMRHQTCSARFSDMKRKGWLVTRGKRRTRSGCSADVHFEAST
ncbi:hypothetical protein I6F35_02940 [Bradyrhizobium sp. BRP22]|uniref:hypothetical protein n=1 Tax=Bradyrhizobium sp. BRP22 TaxID=2793821 RepID=UPI001CD394BA|nr:hypothetical protein [Bradyrhizobium sp. BRP22]MCA1452171.1 hypothetical protein [Bradyrhizobium sp. BRP22]